MIYLDEFQKALHSIVCTEKREISYPDMLEKILQLLRKAKENQNMLYFIGNGGSAGIAMHMTTDFLKNGNMRTHGMHDPAMLTCLGNDYGYEHVFDKQIEMMARSQDVLFAISSSGNSPNIFNAVGLAKEKGCAVVTLSGFRKDNLIRQEGDYNIYVPSMEYGIVESIHNLVLQQIVDMLKEGKWK